ncbi:MAG: hypothetical protein C0507_02495 [Cyanobacteria bacterium PR.3.49]|jgi:hypothetical protein|nr:hypothetical protein [Cyanobacteria bacterium PR.3.49]
MSAKEAVMRIESAAQNQGIEEAATVMREQITELQSMPGGQGDEQLAMVAKQLQRDGLLPDLAIHFALTEDLNGKNDGTFDTEDLYQYQSGKDPLTRAITENLIANYENLRNEHGDAGILPQDWFGLHWVTKNDLKNAAEDISTKRYDFGIDLPEDEQTRLKDNGFFPDIQDRLNKMMQQYAEHQWQQKNPEAEVQPGDGFDRVSRRELQQRLGNVTEAQVQEYSRRLAEYNKMDRDSTVLQPGQRLRLPYIEEQVAAQTH